MSAAAFVGTIMIDCNDLDTMAAFWKATLGLEEKVRHQKYVWLGRLSEKGPALAFQQVPEPRVGKNRIHLDIAAADPEAFTQRVISLGGAKLEDHEMSGFRWSVLADPEGNVFCVSPAAH
jgi:catechol 2,3-dioxygenase-like lactoylglutathione lyase family enzyme